MLSKEKNNVLLILYRFLMSLPGYMISYYFLLVMKSEGMSSYYLGAYLSIMNLMQMVPLEKRSLCDRFLFLKYKKKVFS